MKNKKRWRNVFYAILIGFAVISFWRGIWGLMDLYLFPNNLALSFTISTIIGILILYSIKHKLDSLV